MKLQVPLIYQKEHSNDCGIACIEMILAYYGIKIKPNEIKREIEQYPFGTYAPDLAAYFLGRVFEVTITTLNPGLFSIPNKNYSDQEIYIHLEAMEKRINDKNKQITIQKFKKFIGLGGKIEIKIPVREDIITEIENKRPVIVSLTSNFLLNKVPNFIFHFNVVTGYEGDYVYINDPLLKYGGERKYKFNDFIYGIHASAYGGFDNACILKITKAN